MELCLGMGMSVKYHIALHKGINLNDIEKLAAFGHGFFQDMFTFMEHLKLDYITKKQAIAYRDHLLQPYKKKSGRRHQYGTPIPGARPIGIKLKGEPCKGC